MKILITGINSALGEAVALGLHGHELLGLGRRPHGQFPTIVRDLRENLGDLQACDVCLHLAAVTDTMYCQQYPEDARKVNVIATKALLKHASRFVFVSTGSVYGFGNEPAMEDSQLAPTNDYAQTKLEAEQAVRQHANAVVLRCFYPYGPGTKPDSLVNRLITRIAGGQKVELHEEGRPRINPIYLRDFVQAMRLFCEGSQQGVYNLAGREVVTVGLLATRIGELLGKRPKYLHTGNRVADMVGNTEKLGKIFSPTVDIATGLQATVRYWQSCRMADVAGAEN